MNWITIKSLNEIYQQGQTKIKATLTKDSVVKSILGTKELIEVGDFLIPGEGFKEYYERYHFDNFLVYTKFLQVKGFLKPQTRFEESDINVLMDIDSKIQSGELLEIRNQMIEAEESVRGVSSMFFKNEKYLLNKDSLIDAVKEVLGIKELADDKDQQYKYVLECANPRAIVLCENLDFLKKPSKPRKHNIELWYAGGKNVSKLDYIDLRGLPVFYSCDWDYDGLSIYETIKSMDSLMDIQLLNPTAQPKSLKHTEHKSLWKKTDQSNSFSNLNANLYSRKSQEVIRSLIELDHWIIEEDNDLIKMVEEQI